MVAEDGDPRPGHVADREDHVFDLLVALKAAQHHLVVEVGRNVLDGRELEPELLYSQAQFDQVVELPAAAGTR